MASPKLSVVIIGYNMARELPRTIRSFSPQMQRDIDAAAYELILVDNGSTAPFDAEALKRSASNLTILSARRRPRALPWARSISDWRRRAAIWSGCASMARAWPRLACSRSRSRHRGCMHGP